MPLVIGGDRASLGSKGFDLYRCRLLGANVPEFRIVPAGWRRNLGGGRPDREIREDLRTAFGELGGDVAVRSSCVEEDLEDRSNAGRFRTVLNVRDEEALIEAVERVWASAEGADMAVIVQRQLHPSMAGVAFTVDPVTMEERVVIEHVTGMGDGLVQGRRTPVREVFKGDPGPSAPLGPLVREALRLSRAFGHPLDIEWAVCKGELSILQARPVTALGIPPPGAARTYSRVQAEQFNSGPVSPLYFSFFRTLHERHFLKDTLERIGLDIYREGSIVRHKDHMYFDTRYMEYALSRLPVRGWLAGTVPDDMGIGGRRFPDPALVLRAVRLVAFDPRLWIWNLDRYFMRSVAPRIASGIGSIGDLGGMSNTELADTYRRILDLAALHISTAKWGLALYSIPLAHRSSGRTGGGRTEDASRSLEGLAEIARADPDLLEALKRCLEGPDILESSARTCAGGDLFIDGFRSLLRSFGHRRLARDIMHPSWGEDPRVPLSMIVKMALSPKVDDREIFRQGGRGIVGRYADRYAAFREDQRFYLDMVFSKARELFVEIGARMENDGALADRDDVFFIEAEDAVRWLEDGDGGDLARKATFNRLSFDPERRTPGRFMRHMIDFDDAGTREAAPSRAGDIFGEAISPGSFRGKVRVLRHADEGFGVESGDVVVARALDPGQTHLLMLAGALVLEVGGVLSHGAILARERRVPTVGCVRDATRLLKDGQTVLVDGSRGLISVVDGT